jgi:hypothetical protein
MVAGGRHRREVGRARQPLARLVQALTQICNLGLVRYERCSRGLRRSMAHQVGHDGCCAACIPHFQESTCALAT